MRQLIRSENSEIQAFDALERQHLEESLAWIDSGAELCRQQKPATPPRHLVSYFAFDRPEFKRIQWFHRDEVPLYRSDPHLGRFLEKISPFLSD